LGRARRQYQGATAWRPFWLVLVTCGLAVVYARRWVQKTDSPASTQPPGEDTLKLALQENFNHARHQETQRERYNTVYWFLWAAVLAYVGRQGDFLGNLHQNAFLFAFLAAISIATLVTSLKFNAEFANHLSSVAAIATRLGLNSSTTRQEANSNRPLPYPEFRGYLALPLSFPIYLNVGAWLSIIYCVGLALAVFLMVYGLTDARLTAVVYTAVAATTGLTVCCVMYVLMNRGVARRRPRMGRTGAPRSGNGEQ
jgi:hypothetical protein